MKSRNRKTRRLGPALSAGSAMMLASVCLTPAADKLGARVDEVFRPWNKPDSPGAAVVVVKDGAVVCVRGYGFADLEQRVPITPQTVFDAASVAKQFTGFAIATLIEQKKVSLSDDVHKFLPQVPDFGPKITVEHLLHHTSGLRDWPETLTFSGMSYEDPITLRIIMDMVERQRELDFAPGTEFSYSNTGYNLLAAIIEKVSDKSFRAWAEQEIFRPLRMKQTHVCDDPDELVPNRAASYDPAGNGEFQRSVNQLAAPGSSSLLITAEDMGKWLLNFESGKIGGRKIIDAMQQHGRLNNGSELDYALGLGVDRHRLPGERVVMHSGSWAGFRSVTLWIPERHFGAAILANVATLEPSALVWKVAELYCDDLAPKKVKTKESTAGKAIMNGGGTNWEAHLGTYRLGPGWLLTISREGNQLFTQATREAKFKMMARSGNEFFVDAYGAAIEFFHEKSDDYLRYRDIKAPKLSLPDCSGSYLASFVGDYWSDELRAGYQLELRDGKLRTWHRAAGWINLLPTGTDRFDTETRSMVQFARNDASQVKGLKISGGRVRNLWFRKVSLKE